MNLSKPSSSVPSVRTQIHDVQELSKHSTDLKPIDETCPCPTCRDGTSRAMLHHIVSLETAAAHGQLPEIGFF